MEYLRNTPIYELLMPDVSETVSPMVFGLLVTALLIEGIFAQNRVDITTSKISITKILTSMSFATRSLLKIETCLVFIYWYAAMSVYTCTKSQWQTAILRFTLENPGMTLHFAVKTLDMDDVLEYFQKLIFVFRPYGAILLTLLTILSGVKATITTMSSLNGFRDSFVLSWQLTTALERRINHDTTTLGQVLTVHRMMNKTGDHYINVFKDRDGKIVGHCEKDFVTNTPKGFVEEARITIRESVRTVRNRSTAVFWDNEGRIVAHGVRVGDRLYTAKHAVGLIRWVSTGDLEDPTEKHKDVSEGWNMFTEYDLAWLQCDKNFFTDMHLANCEVLRRVPENAHLVIRSFTKEYGWVADEGRVKEYVEGVVTHNVNTVPGVSGAPVFSGNRLVGLHVGYQPKHECNVLIPCFKLLPLFEPAYVSKLFLSVWKGNKMIEETIDNGKYLGDDDTLYDRAQELMRIHRLGELDLDVSDWGGLTRDDYDLTDRAIRYMDEHDIYYDADDIEDLLFNKGKSSKPSSTARESMRSIVSAIKQDYHFECGPESDLKAIGSSPKLGDSKEPEKSSLQSVTEHSKIMSTADHTGLQKKRKPRKVSEQSEPAQLNGESDLKRLEKSTLVLTTSLASVLERVVELSEAMETLRKEIKPNSKPTQSTSGEAGQPASRTNTSKKQSKPLPRKEAKSQ